MEEVYGGSAPDSARAGFEALAARVFKPNREEILSRWAGAYEAIDTASTFKPEEFTAFCARELDALIAALDGGDINTYLTNVASVGVELAESGFSFERIPALVHELEDSYNPFLFREFHHSPELPHLLHELDSLLHDALEALAASYFDVARAKVTQELTIGRVLEAAFRPQAAPPVPGIAVGLEYRSATEKALIGGDFFDFFFLPDGRLAFVIGDVSGKGINAASNAAMAKHMLRGFACAERRAETVMTKLSRALGYLLAPHEFVTAIFSIYTPKTAEIEMVGAGHPPALLVSSAGDVRPLETGGVPLGIDDRRQAEPVRLKLSRGDRILFYTDGLSEARSGPDFYGYDRPARVLRKRHGLPPQEIVDNLVADCLRFCDRDLKDDLAVICFGKE